MDCPPHFTTSRDAYEGPSSDRSASTSYNSNSAENSRSPGAGTRPRARFGSAPALAANIVTWGRASARVTEFESLRKMLPSWVSSEVSNHFFRYSDEQTILAAWAIDDALGRAGMQAADASRWGILAAPEFLGRQHVAAFLDKYVRHGGARVSPNSIVQHSLHSVSGSLSILLASRGPNVGIGGGQKSLQEGLIAALTLFELPTTAGCWFVATAWNPLPLPDEQGECADEATCHAVVLGLGASTSPSLGQVLLRDHRGAHRQSDHDFSVLGLLAALDQLRAGGGAARLNLRLAWGPELGVELRGEAAAARRAA